jgi:hypothetical protein
MDGIANFVASLVVDSQVVLLTTMLLDFRHDFLFAIALTCQSQFFGPTSEHLKLTLPSLFGCCSETLGFMFASYNMLRPFPTSGNTLMIRLSCWVTSISYFSASG